MPARLLFLFLLFVSTNLFAQTGSAITPTADSIGLASAADSSLVKNDSVIPPKPLLTWQQDTAFTHFFINKNAPRNAPSVYAINAVRQSAHEDEPFYILAGLLLFTGIIRALFPKYFTTLYQSFLQSSVRSRQSKESMAQEALPSFLMNLLFVLSGGLLLATFIKGDDISHNLLFPILWLYASAALAVIYIGKSVFITFFGWAFNIEAAAGSYRTIVFLVNKIAGLCFIPLLLILIYATGNSFATLTTVTLSVVVILLLYRYIISLSAVGKNLKINPLHFFLYLCAVEILPLLITYKLLLITREL